MVLLAASLVGAAAARAVSYDPLTPDLPAAGERALEAGARVALFHSGTDDVRRAVHPGDTVAVFRPGHGDGRVAVGRVRLTAAAGELCFSGEVVEGSVRQHDVAKSGPAALLVVPASACNPAGGR